VTVYLDLEMLLKVADRAVGGEAMVRDHGLLLSALARPATHVFGTEAYPTLEGKAAALLHSLACNHALVDGNKRLAWLATAVFFALNNRELVHTDDDAFDLMINVASGRLRDVQDIAATLRPWIV